MKGQKLLKVTSILMIIGGVIAVIAGILAILGISALVALSESAEGAGLLYASSIIVVVASVIQFIAGIKGIGACSAPQKAASCIKWGIIIAGPEHHLHDHWPDRRWRIQHCQPGSQLAAAGTLHLQRCADERQH